MGVPSFYRWLVKKYPEIVSDASEEKPNGLEFDNLYLDMNAIIHPCFHPEDNLFPPTTFQDVFSNIYDYIDKLFNIVRPRKLLFMAIDGVAPRAKLNQQRTRRFRTSRDNEVAEEVEMKFRKQFEMEGKKIFPKEESELSDTNIITPGTEFMYILSKKLQSYIKSQMTNDSHWKRIKVILSDANVPGEGEHKIMSFIRGQRCSEGYNPNTRHCLYGLDADLIILALATHEVHFSILRELAEKQGSCHSEVASGSGTSNGYNEDNKKLNRRAPVMKKPFQYLHVWLLREYLHLDMNISDPPENVKVDLECIIDDFIFICFLTGNDFLPHMPTLEIHEGAIDLLMHVYKKDFKNLGGYLVDTQRIEDKKGGYMKLKRVEKFILAVGEFEEKIFNKRAAIREHKIRRIQSERSNAENPENPEYVDAQSCMGSTDYGFCGRKSLGILDTPSDKKDTSLRMVTKEAANSSEVLNNTRELKMKMKDYIFYQSDTFRNGGILSDKVKLGHIGWKKRYYEVKFSTKTPEEMESTRKKLVVKYIEGLCWILKYYFSGVPSWSWFYPYHYGPFASDLKGLTQVTIKFQNGLPLKPFDQLLAVLPPKSANALPEVYKKLMVDEDSNIVDFYPTKFQMDADGKRFMWQAICKVPFIQEDRLLAETRKVEKELKDNEKERNAETADKLFVLSSTGLGEQISSFYNNYSSLALNGAIKINNILSDGVNGFMHLCEEKDRDVFCVFYKLPEDCIPRYHLVEGVNIPDKLISEADLVETSLWHEASGSSRDFVSKKDVLKSSPKNKEPQVICKGAGIGWGRGRGKINNSDFQSMPSPALKPYAQYEENRFSPSPASSSSAILKSSQKNKEPQVICKGARIGWGRGRGKIDDNNFPSVPSPPLKPYAQFEGNRFSPSRTSSSSASSLSWRLEKQLNVASSDKGSWQNCSTRNARPAWRQIQPISSSSPGQHVIGRGQYLPKTSTTLKPADMEN